MENSIEINNLSKSFKDVKAVNDLSFKVKKGEFFAFLENRFGEKLARMRLEITDSNVNAKRLYKRLGFEELDYRQMVKEFRKG